MTTYWVTLKTPAYKSFPVEAEDTEGAEQQAMAQAFTDDTEWEVNPNDPPEVGDVVEE